MCTFIYESQLIGCLVRYQQLLSAGSRGGGGGGQGAAVPSKMPPNLIFALILLTNSVDLMRG